MAAKPVFTCTRCRKQGDASMFGYSRDGQRLSVCRVCRKLQKNHRDRKRILENVGESDWAAALHRSTIATYRCDEFDGFSPNILRALGELQHGLCALSHKAMLMPEEVQYNTGMKAVHNSYPPEQRPWVVDVTRADSGKPWEPGNLILVAHAFKYVYESYGNVRAFKAFCSNFDGLYVFDEEMLACTRDGMALDRLRAFEKTTGDDKWDD